MENSKEEYKELLARIEDIARRADSGLLAATKFLSPAEVFYAKEILAAKGLEKRAFLFGGYDGAERERLIILPSYLDGYELTPRELLFECFPDEAAELVRVVKITGSGYVPLSHRDHLGAILGLGVERDAVGDIIVTDDRTALVFASDAIAKLMLEGLTKVASDKVKLEVVGLGAGFAYKREFQSVSDTVASERLDCVVAALANLSRERAQNLIESGSCLLCYAEEIRCDRSVKAGDIVTLRGYGKFIVREIDRKTKKGRLRLTADKYV